MEQGSTSTRSRWRTRLIRPNRPTGRLHLFAQVVAATASVVEAKVRVEAPALQGGAALVASVELEEAVQPFLGREAEGLEPLATPAMPAAEEAKGQWLEGSLEGGPSRPSMVRRWGLALEVEARRVRLGGAEVGSPPPQLGPALGVRPLMQRLRRCDRFQYIPFVKSPQTLAPTAPCCCESKQGVASSRRGRNRGDLLGLKKKFGANRVCS